MSRLVGVSSATGSHTLAVGLHSTPHETFKLTTLLGFSLSSDITVAPMLMLAATFFYAWKEPENLNNCRSKMAGVPFAQSSFHPTVLLSVDSQKQGDCHHCIVGAR